MDREQIAYGILAGGKSSRMGRNKLVMKYKEKPIIQWVIDSFNSKKCYISVADLEGVNTLRKEIVNDDVIFVTDKLIEYGPLEGLRRLLMRIDKEYLMVFSGDMPLVNKEFVEALAEEYRGENALVVTSGDIIHPTCGIYSKKLLGKIEELIKKDEHRLKELINDTYVRYVDIEKIGFSDNTIMNVNTKEDYDELIRG